MHIDQNLLMRQHKKDLKFFIGKSLSFDCIENIARQTGFTQRTGKVPAEAFVNALMIPEHTLADTSLPDIAAVLRLGHSVEVSKEALHQKFNKRSVALLEGLLTNILSEQLKNTRSENLITHFGSIKIKDSTKFSLPDHYDHHYKGFTNFSKTNGLLCLQYEYDLISGDWINIKITPGLRNDQRDALDTIDDITPGDLYIRDLGYATSAYLEAVVNKKAFFLNRLPAMAGVFTSDGKPLSWGKLHSKIKKAKSAVMDIETVIYEKNKIPARLIIEPVDNQEYKRRLEKAKNTAKSKNIGISKEHKLKLRYNLFITNAPAVQLAAKSIRKVYYLRWQIELVFKTWKSFFRINQVKKVKRERLETQLLARLLWILINWQIFKTLNQHVKKLNNNHGISLIIFFKRCMKFASTLRLVLLRKFSIYKWLTQIYLPLIKDCLCDAPKNKDTHYQTLNFNYVP